MPSSVETRNQRVKPDTRLDLPIHGAVALHAGGIRIDDRNSVGAASRSVRQARCRVHQAGCSDHQQQIRTLDRATSHAPDRLRQALAEPDHPRMDQAVASGAAWRCQARTDALGFRPRCIREADPRASAVEAAGREQAPVKMKDRLGACAFMDVLDVLRHDSERPTPVRAASAVSAKWPAYGTASDAWRRRHSYQAHTF